MRTIKRKALPLNKSKWIDVQLLCKAYAAEKNWKAQFILIRSKIAPHFKQEEERHYAYWLIKGYAQFSEMMQGNVPPPHFEIDKDACKRIADYIQRQVKKHRPKQPVVKKAR